MNKKSKLWDKESTQSRVCSESSKFSFWTWISEFGWLSTNDEFNIKLSENTLVIPTWIQVRYLGIKLITLNSTEVEWIQVKQLEVKDARKLVCRLESTVALVSQATGIHRGNSSQALSEFRKTSVSDSECSQWQNNALQWLWYILLQTTGIESSSLGLFCEWSKCRFKSILLRKW